MGPVLLGGAEGKKSFQHPRTPSYWWEISWDSFEGLEESTAASLWCQDRVKPTKVGDLRDPAQDMCLPVWMRDRYWTMGFDEQTSGKDCCWL